MSDDTKEPKNTASRRSLEARRAIQRERRARRAVARNRRAQVPAEGAATPTAATGLAKNDAPRNLAAKSVAAAEPSVTKLTPQSWPATVLPLQILLDSRRARQRGFIWRIGLFCGLPTLLTLLYMLFIASPRYTAEFEITYQAYQPQQSLASGLVQNFLGTSQGSSVDLSVILYEYLQSQALLLKLDKDMNLRNYYSDSKIDYFSRMSPHANIDTFQRYYNWYVSVSQGAGGYLTIDVQGFDPEYTLALSNALIKAVDEMIDNLTARARQDEVRFAETQVAQGEDRMRKARMALTKFQNEHGDINPEGSVTQLSGIVGQIEGELATQRASLASVKTLGPSSPQVTAINSRIAALEEQLKQQRQRLTKPSGSGVYSDLLDQYSALQLDQEFAKNAYMAAQQGLAVARADASSKQNYLIDFAPPQTPAKQGVRLTVKYTLTVLILSLVLFGLGSLVAGAMRDQTGI